MSEVNQSINSCKDCDHVNNDLIPSFNGIKEEIDLFLTKQKQRLVDIIKCDSDISYWNCSRDYEMLEQGLILFLCDLNTYFEDYKDSMEQELIDLINNN